MTRHLGHLDSEIALMTDVKQHRQRSQSLSGAAQLLFGTR